MYLIPMPQTYYPSPPKTADRYNCFRSVGLQRRERKLYITTTIQMRGYEPATKANHLSDYIHSLVHPSCNPPHKKKLQRDFIYEVLCDTGTTPEFKVAEIMKVVDEVVGNW